VPAPSQQAHYLYSTHAREQLLLVQRRLELEERLARLVTSSGGVDSILANDPARAGNSSAHADAGCQSTTLPSAAAPPERDYPFRFVLPPPGAAPATDWSFLDAVSARGTRRVAPYGLAPDDIRLFVDRFLDARTFARPGRPGSPKAADEAVEAAESEGEAGPCR